MNSRQAKLPELKGNVKVEGGTMKQLKHWSEANKCDMTFSVFLPEKVQGYFFICFVGKEVLKT